MPRRIAVIPARGGSKRLPDKNVRDFCGKPMIGHILDAARDSGVFDVIHLSTDAPRIAEAAEAMGYPVQFMRPRELADDHTPLMPVLRYVLERFQQQGEHFDQLCLLMACAPLVEGSDLTAAAAQFDANGGERPLMAISPFPVPVEWAYRKREDGLMVPVQPGMFAVRSQDLEKAYYETGSFTFFPAHTILAAEGAGSDANYVGYPLSRVKAVDIDDAEDWALAETLYRGRQQANPVARLGSMRPYLTLWIDDATCLRPLHKRDGKAMAKQSRQSDDHDRLLGEKLHKPAVAKAAIRRTDGLLLGIHRDGHWVGAARLADLTAPTVRLSAMMFHVKTWARPWVPTCLEQLAEWAGKGLGVTSLAVNLPKGHPGERAYRAAGFRRGENSVLTWPSS